MEYIIYNKLTDRLYLMYLDNDTWSGAMYYYGQKWSFNKESYINSVVNNKDLEFISEL